MGEGSLHQAEFERQYVAVLWNIQYQGVLEKSAKSVQVIIWEEFLVKI